MTSYQKVIDDQQVFSTFDVMKYLEIKRGRFNQWKDGGFLPRGRQVEWGKGTKTVYSKYELYSIELFKRIVDFKLSRAVAKRYVDYVNWEWMIENKRTKLAVHVKKQIVDTSDGGSRMEVSEGRSFLRADESMDDFPLMKMAFIVDIEDAMEFVDSRT